MEFSTGSKDLREVKKEAEARYVQKRDRLKKQYHFDNGDENMLIDCHKIATCFLRKHCLSIR